jgi:lipopolysaccharide export system permease protein
MTGVATIGLGGPRRPPRRNVRARLSATLSVYIAQQVLLGIAVAWLGLSMVALVIDLIELLRRAGGRPDFRIDVVLAMALLHLPFLMQKLMPFSVLFGTMFSFQRLTRSQELVAARAVGVSVWQFLLPPLLVAFALGVFVVTLFNPLASILFARYETLDQTYYSDRASLVAVSPGGLWLRQQEGKEELLLHARQMTRDPPVLVRVVVFFYEDLRFIGRADAAYAQLQPGYWQLVDPIYSLPDGGSERRAELRIPTDLTQDRIQESYAAPETTSFWDLPSFIETLEAVGFSAREHRLYWHGLVALPMLLCAMLLIGATFSLRLVRHGGTGLFITGGLLTGFAFYILSDVVFAIGLSGRLPAALAAWTPAGVAILLGVTTLLHLEDG